MEADCTTVALSGGISTSCIMINDNESGLHHDYEVWLEKLAPHAPTSQYHHNRTGEDMPTHTSNAKS